MKKWIKKFIINLFIEDFREICVNIGKTRDFSTDYKTDSATHLLSEIYKKLNN